MAETTPKAIEDCHGLPLWVIPQLDEFPPWHGRVILAQGKPCTPSHLECKACLAHTSRFPQASQEPKAMLRRHPHTPAHLALDNAAYFITGAIYGKRHLLRDDALKQELLRFMRQYFAAYAWELQHWVILGNHYHLLARSQRGEDLPQIIGKLHSRSARSIRQATACELPVWWNYWDYCPRGEQDYCRHLNYLLYNPVKHGYVEDLRHYPFSSFHDLFGQLGKAALASQFRAHADFRSLDLPDDF